MNEFLVKVSTTRYKREEFVTVSHAHWMGALEMVLSTHMWASRAEVIKQNGVTFETPGFLHI